MLGGVHANGMLYTRNQVETGNIQDIEIPPALLAAAFSEREFDGKLHVTDLLPGTRQKYLEFTHEHTIHIEDTIAALYGKAMHQVFEKETSKYHLSEVPLEYMNIKMRLDSLYLYESGQLIISDNKILGSYGIAKFLGIRTVKIPVKDEYGNPKLYKSGKKAGTQVTINDIQREPNAEDQFDYTMQLNAYRVALDDNLASLPNCDAERWRLYPFAGRKVTQMRLLLIPRDGNLREAVSRGVVKPYYYEPVEVMPDGYVRGWLTTRRDLLMRAIETKTMPSLCSPKEAWQGAKCKRYCPVARYCVRHGDNTYIGANNEPRDNTGPAQD